MVPVRSIIISLLLILSLYQLTERVTGDATNCKTNVQDGNPVVQDSGNCKTPSSTRDPIKRPIIFDSDIGSFDDDFVSIALALSQPDLDVKLVVTCTDDTTERARIVAKYLTLIGRDDIPVGIGVKTANTTRHVYWPWAADYDLTQYKGGVFEDGVAEMAKMIESSSVPVDIVAIGPMTNFPSLLQRFPDVIKKAQVRAMGGSVYRGYDNSSQPVPEYNVALCPSCFNTTLLASWNVSFTPLDTSGVVVFNNTQVKQLLSSLNPLGLGVADALAYFCLQPPSEGGCIWRIRYTVMFDSVATLLVLPTMAEKWLVMSRLNITVTSDGSTVVKDTGAPSDVAVDWKQPSGLDDYVQYLADSLTRQNSRLTM